MDLNLGTGIHIGVDTALVPGGGGPPPIPNWTTDPPNVPDGSVNVPFNYNLNADLNTTAGVVITVTAGVLPSGLFIVGTNIVGTPDTEEAQVGIQLTATNVSGSDQSLALDISIGSFSLRLDNPFMNSREVLDLGTETI